MTLHTIAFLERDDQEEFSILHSTTLLVENAAHQILAFPLVFLPLHAIIHSPLCVSVFFNPLFVFLLFSE